jgi:hypothetical protein
MAEASPGVQVARTQCHDETPVRRRTAEQPR